MTPEEFETCWVPVPLRWRHVVTGDVLQGKEAAGLYVERAMRDERGRVVVQVYSAAGVWRGDVDPDETVQVLTPVPMAQAVAITREQIGMQLIARRTDKAA